MVARIGAVLKPFAFEMIYGHYFDRVIVKHGKTCWNAQSRVTWRPSKARAAASEPLAPTHDFKMQIAGRAPLRLATFSLPTHREVVAAALRMSALGTLNR